MNCFEGASLRWMKCLCADRVCDWSEHNLVRIRGSKIFPSCCWCCAIDEPKYSVLSWSTAMPRLIVPCNEWRVDLLLSQLKKKLSIWRSCQACQIEGNRGGPSWSNLLLSGKMWSMTVWVAKQKFFEKRESLCWLQSEAWLLKIHLHSLWRSSGIPLWTWWFRSSETLLRLRSCIAAAICANCLVSCVDCLTPID